MEASNWIALGALGVSIVTGTVAIIFSVKSNNRSKRTEQRVTESWHVVWKTRIEESAPAKIVLTNHGTDIAREVSVTATLCDHTISQRTKHVNGGESLEFYFPNVDELLIERAETFKRESVGIAVPLDAEVAVQWKSKAGTPKSETLQLTKEVSVEF